MFDPYEAGTRLYSVAEVLVSDATNHATAAVIDADEVMLHCRGAACRVKRGATPDATAGYDVILEVGERFHMQVVRGVDKIAVTRDSSDGTLVVTPARVLS